MTEQQYVVLKWENVAEHELKRLRSRIENGVRSDGANQLPRECWHVRPQLSCEKNPNERTYTLCAHYRIGA